VSGCKDYYKFVLSAGAKAKSVTTCPASAGSNLPILSVLAFRAVVITLKIMSLEVTEC